MLPAAVLLALIQAPVPPAAVVRHALAAVEGDSVERVQSAWRKRLGRDPADRTTTLGLASLALYTYRDSVAFHLLRALTSGGASDAVAGYATLSLARRLASRGEWPQADTAAQRAVALGQALHDSVLHGEALIVLATTRRRTQGGMEPAALIAEALHVLPVSAYGARARAMCGGAQLAPGVNDDTVLTATREGAALATRGDDVRARAWCYHVAASVFARRGPAESTFTLYQRAEDDFRRTRDRGGLAVVLQWRGYYNFLLGAFGHARRDSEAAVREAEAAGAWLVVPWARSALARISLQLGDAAQAARHAAEATRLFATQGDVYAAANARALEASLAFALGDTAAARSGFEANMEQVRALGWVEAQASGWEGLMQVALARGDLAAAHRALDSLTAVARRGGMSGRLGAVRHYEGTLALLEGRLALAERIFRSRRAPSTSQQGNWDYVDGARLSEVLMRLGRIAEAEEEIRTATERLDAWRHALGDRELRQLAFQLSQHQADPDLGVATVIAGLSKAGRVGAAFEVAERGRARELADRMNRATAFDSVQAPGVARGDPWIPIGQLMLEIPDSATALFEFVTGLGDPTTLFVVTQRGFRSYVLASQDSLRQPIARLDALLEAGEDARPLSRELGRALLDTAVTQLDASIRRLVIVPDGPLHRVPFDVLVLSDDRFVVERFAVTSAPSASIVAGLWRRRSRAPAAGLLALADPRFAGESEVGSAGADVFRSAASGTGGLPRLRGSGREARAVARYSDQSTVRRRTAASERWLKESPLTTYGVLHFATHALVDEGSIENTALALAPEGNEDGFVRPSELAGLGLQAELVVLSACRTAGGVIVRGEGIQGLAAPLLAAGARAVAATWWPIGDQATVRLVDDFYAAMARGQPAGDALREAKLAALARGAPTREWASFTIVGDPLAHPALRLPRPGPPVLLIAALVLAAVLLGYGVLMRRRRMVERASVPSESTARTHQP